MDKYFLIQYKNKWENITQKNNEYFKCIDDEKNRIGTIAIIKFIDNGEQEANDIKEKRI